MVQQQQIEPTAAARLSTYLVLLLLIQSLCTEVKYCPNSHIDFEGFLILFLKYATSVSY